MASNPMQKKARNSFLLGMLIMMIFAGSIIGILLYKMNEKQKEEEAIELAKVTVYVLQKDVTAGSTVGITDEDGQLVLTTAEVSSEVVPATAVTAITYATYVTENSVFKVDLAAGTILTGDLIVESEDVSQDDTREQEYNVVLLPTYLVEGDYIDIRLRMPTGEDYIVISKKKVYSANEETIWLYLTEAEILTMSNAIVESYQISGSLLYATTYTEPGLQEAASVTYVPSTSVIQLIAADPNIVDTAKNALYQVYNNSALMSDRTDVIDGFISAAEDGQNSVASGTNDEITTQQESRSTYLTELEAAAQ